MDFALSEELQMLREMARDFATEKTAPFADEWDENHYFPYEEAMKPMASPRIFGLRIKAQRKVGIPKIYPNQPHPVVS